MLRAAVAQLLLSWRADKWDMTVVERYLGEEGLAVPALHEPNERISEILRVVRLHGLAVVGDAVFRSWIVPPIVDWIPAALRERHGSERQRWAT